MSAAFVIRKGAPRPTVPFFFFFARRIIGRETGAVLPWSTPGGSARANPHLQQLRLSAPFGGTSGRAAAAAMGGAKPFGTTPGSKSGTDTGGTFGSSTSTSSFQAASGGSSNDEDATVKQAYAEGLINDKKGRYDFNAIGIFLLCAGAVGGGCYGLYRLVAHYVFSPHQKGASSGPGNRKGETLLPAEKNSPEHTPKELHTQRNLLKNKEAPHPAVMQAQQPPLPPK